MPNIWTHIQLGQEAIAQAGLAAWTQNKKHERLFNLGCQGPDFLFYHQFLPWQRINVMKDMGSAMHNKHCGPLLVDLLSSVSPQQPENGLYALGFLLHHILDRHMHPYIFARSGFGKWDHQRFEVLLDSLIMLKKNIATWKTPVWKKIDIGNKFPPSIVQLFVSLSHKYYPELAAQVKNTYWNDAIRDMIRAQRLFYDPYGMKTLLTLNQIEPFVYKRHIPPYDILNEARRAWPDPTGTNETYTTNIADMWDRASEDAAGALSATLAYWQARDHIKDRQGEPADPILARTQHTLHQAIGNRSYETGLELEQNRPIIVEDPIWRH